VSDGFPPDFFPPFAPPHHLPSRHSFVKEIDEDFLCGICYQVLQSPVRTMGAMSVQSPNIPFSSSAQSCSLFTFTPINQQHIEEPHESVPNIPRAE